MGFFYPDLYYHTHYHMTGTIKFYNAVKGFGFIKTDAGNELFFHITNVAEGITPDQLQEGMTVTFVEGMGRKGPQAEQVSLAGGMSSHSDNEEDMVD